MALAVDLTFGTGTIQLNAHTGGELLEIIHVGPGMTVGTAEWETAPDGAVGPDSKPLVGPDIIPGRTDFNGVILGYEVNGNRRSRKIDIRDVGDGTDYATKEALKADIDAAIDAMY